LRHLPHLYSSYIAHVTLILRGIENRRLLAGDEVGYLLSIESSRVHALALPVSRDLPIARHGNIVVHQLLRRPAGGISHLSHSSHSLNKVLQVSHH